MKNSLKLTNSKLNTFFKRTFKNNINNKKSPKKVKPVLDKDSVSKTMKEAQSIEQITKGLDPQVIDDPVEDKGKLYVLSLPLLQSKA